MDCRRGFLLANRVQRSRGGCLPAIDDKERERQGTEVRSESDEADPTERFEGRAQGPQRTDACKVIADMGRSVCPTTAVPPWKIPERLAPSPPGIRETVL
jgi:hypothetical protein